MVRMHAFIYGSAARHLANQNANVPVQAQSTRHPPACPGSPLRIYARVLTEAPYAVPYADAPYVVPYGRGMPAFRPKTTLGNLFGL